MKGFNVSEMHYKDIMVHFGIGASTAKRYKKYGVPKRSMQKVKIVSTIDADNKPAQKIEKKPIVHNKIGFITFYKQLSVMVDKSIYKRLRDIKENISEESYLYMKDLSEDIKQDVLLKLYDQFDEKIINPETGKYHNDRFLFTYIKFTVQNIMSNYRTWNRNNKSSVQIIDGDKPMFTSSKAYKDPSRTQEFSIKRYMDDCKYISHSFPMYAYHGLNIKKIKTWRSIAVERVPSVPEKKCNALARVAWEKRYTGFCPLTVDLKRIH